MDGRGKPLKIAIIGGGISGLAAAIGLTRAGIEVDIYEATAKLGEIGAGVALGPNAIRVLEELELLDHVTAAVLPEMPTSCHQAFRYVFGTGQNESIYDYPVLPEDKSLGIHRVTFLEALVHLIDASRTHCNKRCIGIQDGRSHRMQLLFADGTSADADVVIGADGIRSVVRTFVVEGQKSEADSADKPDEQRNNDLKIQRVAFTNTFAYRGLVPFQQLKDSGVQFDLSERPCCFVGHGKHIITFPIKGGSIINVVAFSADYSIPFGACPVPSGTPWVTPCSTEELLCTYAGWSEDVQLLLGCIAKPSVWAIHAVDPPLDNYVRGSVALLGDAAHAMLPHLGAGAGQCLEDVLVIVKLLTHRQTHVGNIEDVLKAYDAVRRPRSNMVLEKTTQSGKIYDCHGPHGSNKEGVRSDLEGIKDKIWHHDILADVEAAISRLVEAGIFTSQDVLMDVVKEIRS